MPRYNKPRNVRAVRRTPSYIPPVTRSHTTSLSSSDGNISMRDFMSNQNLITPPWIFPCEGGNDSFRRINTRSSYVLVPNGMIRVPSNAPRSSSRPLMVRKTRAATVLPIASPMRMNHIGSSFNVFGGSQESRLRRTPQHRFPPVNRFRRTEYRPKAPNGDKGGRKGFRQSNKVRSRSPLNVYRSPPFSRIRLRSHSRTALPFANTTAMTMTPPETIASNLARNDTKMHTITNNGNIRPTSSTVFQIQPKQLPKKLQAVFLTDSVTHFWPTFIANPQLQRIQTPAPARIGVSPMIMPQLNINGESRDNSFPIQRCTLSTSQVTLNNILPSPNATFESGNKTKERDTFSPSTLSLIPSLPNTSLHLENAFLMQTHFSFESDTNSSNFMPKANPPLQLESTSAKQSHALLSTGGNVNNILPSRSTLQQMENVFLMQNHELCTNEKNSNRVPPKTCSTLQSENTVPLESSSLSVNKRNVDIVLPKLSTEQQTDNNLIVPGNEAVLLQPTTMNIEPFVERENVATITTSFCFIPSEETICDNKYLETNPLQSFFSLPKEFEFTIRAQCQIDCSPAGVQAASKGSKRDQILLFKSVNGEMYEEKFVIRVNDQTSASGLDSNVTSTTESESEVANEESPASVAHQESPASVAHEESPASVAHEELPASVASSYPSREICSSPSTSKPCSTCNSKESTERTSSDASTNTDFNFETSVAGINGITVDEHIADKSKRDNESMERKFIVFY